MTTTIDLEIQPYAALAVSAADRAVDAAIDDLLSNTFGYRAIIVTAPTGAGKSSLIVQAVIRARRRNLRVVVAALPNEQAMSLVQRIAIQYCAGASDRFVTFVPASTVSLSETIRNLPGVRQPEHQLRMTMI